MIMRKHFLFYLFFLLVVNTYSALDETEPKEFVVVGVERLMPDEGKWVDDKDNDPETDLYILLTQSSGNVTITAQSKPVLTETELPPAWNLNGGNGTNKLERTIDKTTPGLTVIECVCGSSKRKISYYVIEVSVASMGYTNDIDIVKWPSGDLIGKGAANEDKPTWSNTGISDPVCYIKNTKSVLFSSFVVAPAPPVEIPNIQIKVTAQTTQLGLVSDAKINGSNIEDKINTDGDVDNIGNTAVIPGADVVKKLAIPIKFEISIDNGNVWGDGGSPTQEFFVIEDSPQESPLYDLALDKACGYVNGDSNIADKLNSGVDSDITYDPSIDVGGNPLYLYPSGPAQCSNHANLLRYLASSIGINATLVYVWGGCSNTTVDFFKYHTWWGPSFRVLKGAHDGASVNPHFTFHVLTNINGTYFDPSYGSTGIINLDETAPAGVQYTTNYITYQPHTVAASRQTGSSWPPANIHLVDWTCPH